MSPHILVVEDEPAIADLISYNLEHEGFRVTVAAGAEDAELLIAENGFDLIVLDWMLPGVSGLELCRRLRRRPATQTVPVIMLTARGEEADRVRGLGTGADDYVVKPFSTPELLARVKALLRRALPNRVADVLRSGDIVLDRAAHRVTRREREVRLGPTEFRLLAFFIENAGRVLSRQQLLDGVWGRDVFIDGRTVDVHVGRLRKALVHGSDPDPIRTVRGTGYSFEPGPG
jgi:two-component system phosphate regulon response regulator PhoB